MEPLHHNTATMGVFGIGRKLESGRTGYRFNYLGVERERIGAWNLFEASPINTRPEVKMGKRVLQPTTLKTRGHYSPGWEVSGGRLIFFIAPENTHGWNLRKLWSLPLCKITLIIF